MKDPKIKSLRVLRWVVGAAAVRRLDALAVEEPLEIRVDTRPIVVTMSDPCRRQGRGERVVDQRFTRNPQRFELRHRSVVASDLLEQAALLVEELHVQPHAASFRIAGWKLVA